MSDAESVVFTFGAFGKPAQSLLYSVGMEFGSPAGQDFMSIGLVSYIPDKLIVRGIEDIVQGNSHFYHAETGTKMPSFNGNDINDVLPQFTAHLRKLFLRKFPEVFGVNDLA